MRATYDRTMFITKEELPKVKVRLFITEGVKWEDDNETEVIYTGLVRWSIIDGEDAAELEKVLMIDEDEHHKYLILEFNDGKVITFRNSHVDMFLR